MITLSDSIEISAAPATVFDAISHLEAMGRFSPENTGGQWIRGATGPALGARFKGTNSHGKDSWTTTAKVVSYELATSFAFEITVGPVKVSRWEYQIEATPAGSRVTEIWTDNRANFAKRFAKGEVADRESYTRHSIRTTLENLKSFLED